MRRRSFTGPLLLLLVGGLFLWRNLHPETQIFELLSLYWPFLLIAWGFLRLIEVLIWSRDGYRSGLGGGEVVLIVLICIAGSGFWQARRSGFSFNGNGLDIWGQQYDYPVSGNAPADGVKRIVIENARGNIKVTGGDAALITVSGRKLVRAFSRQEAERANGATPLDIRTEGDRLVIRTNQDRASGDRRVSDDLEISAPRGVAVEARATSADYEVADVNGDVSLNVDRGDVRLSRIGGNARLEVRRSELVRATGVKGTLDLQGDGSDIDVEDVGGQVTVSGSFRGALDFKNLAKPLQFEGSRGVDVRIQAVPGHVSMDLGQFSAKDIVGPVRLSTGSRDVKLEQFTVSLNLETDKGDIELTPGKLPLASIDARSSSGRIDLALPAKAAFTLDATAQSGDAINDYGPPVQREVSGRTAALTAKGTGGPAIRLHANKGWISVRKEGTPARDLPDSSDEQEPPPPPKAPAPPSPPVRY